MFDEVDWFLTLSPMDFVTPLILPLSSLQTMPKNSEAVMVCTDLTLVFLTAAKISEQWRTKMWPSLICPMPSGLEVSYNIWTTFSFSAIIPKQEHALTSTEEVKSCKKAPLLLAWIMRREQISPSSLLTARKRDGHCNFFYYGTEWIAGDPNQVILMHYHPCSLSSIYVLWLQK